MNKETLVGLWISMWQISVYIFWHIIQMKLIKPVFLYNPLIHLTKYNHISQMLNIV